MIDITAYTTKGLYRAVNQDGILINDEILTEGKGYFNLDHNVLLAVADGVGGMPHGEVASFETLQVIKSLLQEPDLSGTVVRQTFDQCISRLKELQKTAEKYSGMATTLSGIMINEANEVTVFNIGNSRVYRMRNGFLRQLTTDDTLVNRLPEDIYEKMKQNISHIITKCISATANGTDVVVVEGKFRVQEDDIVVLTTDGVHDYIDLDTLEKIIASGESSDAIISEIESVINEIPQHDNFSIIIAKVRAENG